MSQHEVPPTNSEELGQSKGDRLWWMLRGQSAILVVSVIIGICILGYFVSQPLLTTDSSSTSTSVVTATRQPSITLWRSYHATDQIRVAWSASETNLQSTSQLIALRINVHGNTPISVEQQISADGQLWWLVPSSDRLQYAAYQVTNETSRLIVIKDGGQVIDVTSSTGQSGLRDQYDIDLSRPPLWSDNDHWIAFLGKRRNGDAYELFIADPNTSTAYRLTDDGSAVSAFTWQSNQEIVYAILRADKKIALKQVEFSSSPNNKKSSDLGVLPSK